MSPVNPFLKGVKEGQKQAFKGTANNVTHTDLTTYLSGSLPFGNTNTLTRSGDSADLSIGSASLDGE